MAKKKEPLDANVKAMATKLFVALDTPRSLTAEILMRYEEWDQLLRLQVDPAHYFDSSIGADRYLRDRQASDFLRKYPGNITGVQTDEVAAENWLACEKSCSRTNARLSRFIGPELVFDHQDDARVYEFILRVKKLISGLLGPLPVRVDPKFGNGATFESPTYAGVDTLTVCHKLTYTTAVTREAEALFDHHYHNTAWERGNRDATGYYKSKPRYTVRGNRWGTVRKTALTDRNIGVEPGGNVWLQLGVGRQIRRRLRERWGLLLEEGKSELLHKKLACSGSLVGSHATIDLTNASDTVARLLVKLLLPPEWYDLLESLRSPLSRVSGRRKGSTLRNGWYLLEKFSSMGNGFTFELETLIFAAICKAVVGPVFDYDVNVYGDDIIVPTEFAADCIAALRYFGFEPNKRKTFTSGVFRESCGGDFFLGLAVRPYTLEIEPYEPQHWITVANGLRRAASNSQLRFGPLGYYRAAWFSALDNIPAAIRTHRGPEELGDTVIHDRERTWIKRLCPYRGVTQVKTWSPVGWTYDLERFNGGVQLAAALLGVGSNGVAPREAISGYTTTWTDYIGYGTTWLPAGGGRSSTQRHLAFWGFPAKGTLKRLGPDTIV